MRRLSIVGHLGVPIVMRVDGFQAEYPLLLHLSVATWLQSSSDVDVVVAFSAAT